MTREIRVSWFGRLAGKRGLREEVVSTSARTAAELFEELSAQHELGVSLSELRIAINDEFAAPGTPLVAGDKLVFMTPFAGG